MVRLLAFAAVASAMLVGCSSGPPDPMENLAGGQRSQPPRAGAGSARGAAPSASADDLPPVIVVNNQPVGWADVWEPMAEYSGGVVVEEVALDVILGNEMARRGITIGPAEVEYERSALTRTIAQSVGVGDVEAQQLARRVTIARALGPHREDKLLRRNAMLRVIAREKVAVSEDVLRRAYEIDHGRRYVTRIITTPSHQEAARLRDQIVAGPADSIRSRFAEAAVAHSTDPTGAAGGLLGPLSPQDTSLPGALRDALTATPVGTVSAVMALDTSVAIALIETEVAPTGVAFESVRPALEVSVRDRLERIEMDLIAREMLAGARISVFDRSLNWGFVESRRGN